MPVTFNRCGSIMIVKSVNTDRTMHVNMILAIAMRSLRMRRGSSCRVAHQWRGVICLPRSSLCLTTYTATYDVFTAIGAGFRDRMTWHARGFCPKHTARHGTAGTIMSHWNASPPPITITASIVKHTVRHHSFATKPLR